MTIQTLDLDTFNRFIGQDNKCAVVYFSASWCGPCASMKPSFERLSLDYQDRAAFGHVDVGTAPSLASSLGIHGVPSFGFFSSGRLEKLHIGVSSYGQLQTSLERELRKPE